MASKGVGVEKNQKEKQARVSEMSERGERGRAKEMLF